MTIIEYSQFSLFIFFCLAGFLLSIPLSIISNFLKIKFNKYVFVLFDILSTLSISSVFLFVSNILCYGELRLFTFLALTLGIILEKISTQKLFGFFIKRIYNIFVRINSKFKNTNFFKFISK